MRGLLVLVGSMLMCAWAASPAAPLVAADRGLTDGWLHYGRVLEHVAVIRSSSEPMGLLLLGVGFVIAANQIRRKC